MCLLQALRCFDGSDNLVPVRRAQAFLLRSQQADGSWSHLHQNESPTQIYATTTNALLALDEPKSLGFAPSVPELVPILEMHLNANISIQLVRPACCACRIDWCLMLLAFYSQKRLRRLSNRLLAN